MNESNQILVGIPKSHTAAYARLEERCRTAHAERDHALVLIPDVHHSVEALVAALNAILAEQLVPQRTKFGKHCVHCLDRSKAADHLMRARLVNNVMILVAKAGEFTTIGGKLLIFGVLLVAKDKDEIATLAGLELHFDIMACDRTPAVCKTVSGMAVEHSLRFGKLVVQADKRLAVGIITLNGAVDGIVSVMIAALLVFGLMVEGREICGLLNLHLTGRKVALEVLTVRGTVPEAPLGITEELDAL